MKRLASLSLGVNQYYVLLNRPFSITLESTDGSALNYSFPVQDGLAVSLTDFVVYGNGVLTVEYGGETVFKTRIAQRLEFSPKISMNFNLEKSLVITFTPDLGSNENYLNVLGFKTVVQGHQR